MVQGEGRSYLQAAYFQVSDENIVFSLSQYLKLNYTFNIKHYIYIVCLPHL